MRAATVLGLLVAGCATSTPPAAPAPPPVALIHDEPLRLSGELPPAPASAGPPGTLLDGRYLVCLDNGGRVASVKPLKGIAHADEAVMAALHGWSWFVVYRDSAPTCFATTVHLAVPAPSQIVRQAGASVTATPLHLAPVAPPPWLASVYAGTAVEGSYKVCVGDDGLVRSVRPIGSVPGADDAFMAALHASSWDLRVGPLATAPFCFAAPVRVDERHATPGVEVPPALPFPPEMARPERGVSIVVLLHKLAGDAPVAATAAAYRQCISYDGSVATVEPLAGGSTADRSVIETLRNWRFELRGPGGMGVCYATALHPKAHR